MPAIVLNSLARMNSLNHHQNPLMAMRRPVYQLAVTVIMLCNKWPPHFRAVNSTSSFFLRRGLQGGQSQRSVAADGGSGSGLLHGPISGAWSGGGGYWMLRGEALFLPLPASGLLAAHWPKQTTGRGGRASPVSRSGVGSSGLYESWPGSACLRGE